MLPNNLGFMSPFIVLTTMSSAEFTIIPKSVAVSGGSPGCELLPDFNDR
jgi:hypothetical protein